MRSEASLQAWFTRVLNSHGAYTQKLISASRRGFPDMLVIYQGDVWFVELKQENGHPSVFQDREINRLRTAGANALIVYGKQGCEDFIHYLLKEDSNDNNSI